MAKTEAKTDEPQSLADFIASKQEQGLSDDEIMVLANSRFGGQDSPVAQPPRGGEALGPDPEMVRRYNLMMKDYKPPKLRFKLAALRADDEQLGKLVLHGVIAADRSMSREKKEAIVEAVLASLDTYGGIELPKQFHEWVLNWRAWESARRRMKEPMTENAAIELICREHWHQHGDIRALMHGAMTGPAGLFKPDSGNWGG